MSDATEPNWHCRSLAIVGVGLIGGSIASAVRARGLADRIIGIGRNEARLKQAVDSGLIHEASTDLTFAAEAELIIVCTPVDRIADDVLDVLRHDSAAIVTDAGSVKASICRQVANAEGCERFIGSHPLAGSEKGGFEHADSALFENRVCVLTPNESTPESTNDRVSAFWQALGMTVRHMSPEKHDRLLALASHLPHLASAAIAGQLTEEAAAYASTGFRDTTRVASGDPGLWTAILMENRLETAKATHDLIATLNEFQAALESSNAATIHALLSSAQQSRQQFLNCFLRRGSGAP